MFPILFHLSSNASTSKQIIIIRIAFILTHICFPHPEYEIFILSNFFFLFYDQFYFYFNFTIVSTYKNKTKKYIEKNN